MDLARFEAIKLDVVKIKLLWNVTPCSLVGSCSRVSMFAI